MDSSRPEGEPEMSLPDKAVEAGVDAALKAREERDKRRKITDYGMVAISIRVDCTVAGSTFAPPLDVFVNNVKKPERINPGVDDEFNELDLWLVVGVDSDGVRPVTIRLAPTDGAELYFKAGQSPKTRLEPAFFRTEVEKSGGDFSDANLKRPDIPHHVVRITVKPSRTKWFRSRTPAEIPKRWRRQNQGEDPGGLGNL